MSFELPVKVLKYVNDPCFGMKFGQTGSCPQCWISQSCQIRFRNVKK